jgi:hypothetical protein
MGREAGGAAGGLRAPSHGLTAQGGHLGYCAGEVTGGCNGRLGEPVSRCPATSGRWNRREAGQRCPVVTGGRLARGLRAQPATHRARLAAEIHVPAGDQSQAAAHSHMVRGNSYKVNWENR